MYSNRSHVRDHCVKVSLTQQQYEQVVDQLNRQMQADNRNLRFGVDRRINTFVITVTDKNTGDVVRQIPAESVLRVAHSIENLKGVLYNEKA